MMKTAMTMLHTFQQILPEPAKQVLAQHGWRRFLGLPFYPIILLITTPLRLMQTLWNCRVLADGKWEDYNRFAPHHALNSLVYRTFAINFSRFGRSGRSSYLGNGEYFLGRGWAYSLPSLYAYWRFGPIVPLAGMFGWWVAHILWVDLPGNLLWKGLVIMLTLVSTTCYANTFALQNYNALGWVFMPIGLYGWATGHWMLAMLSWFGASFGSFTVVFLACLLSLAESMHLRNFWPLLSVIPAGIKLLTHFWPLAGSGNIWRNLHDIAKALGLSRRNVKYVYTKGLRFNLSKLYYAGLYGQFLAIVWLAGNRIPVLLIAAILIWLINSRVARFADEQSMQMLVLSVATATMLPMPDPDALLFISFWLLASPLPLFAGFPGTPLLTVPVYAPFYLAPLVAEMEEFLAPVSKGQRVLVAFEDPQGIYENVLMDTARCWSYPYMSQRARKSMLCRIGGEFSNSIMTGRLIFGAGTWRM